MPTAVLGHKFPHPDAPLAREEDRWQWLSGITGRYMYHRAVTMWMVENQALDVDDFHQYPWSSRPLSMSEWSVRKVFVIGLKRDPNMRMAMSEDALDALFRMWDAAGLGMHRPGTEGCGKSTGPRFFFKVVTAPISLMTCLIPTWTLGSTKQAPRSCCRSVPQSAGGTKVPAKPG